MRSTHYLIIALLVCVLPAAASAQVVESSCIARIRTDPSLGIHNTAGMNMQGGMMGEMGMGGMGGYGGDFGTEGAGAGRRGSASNRSVLVDLIHSYPVSGEAARAVFGKTFQELDAQLDVNIYQTTPEVAMIGLRVVVGSDSLPDGQKDASITEKAEEFLSQTLGNLHAVLQRMDEQIREANIEPIQEANAQLERARQQVADLKEHIRQLREKAGSAALSLRDVMNRQRDLDHRVSDMLLELEVAQTMRERLSEHIAEKTDEAEARAEDDEALRALRELLALKKEALDRVAREFENGRAAAGELDQAKAEVTEQLVRLAERREQLVHSLNDGVLASMNSRLNDVLQDTDRLQATLQAYQSQLKQIKEKGLLVLAEEYEHLEHQLEEAQNQARIYADRLMRLKSTAESMRKPQVIVVE